jgi:hypothetical protein
MKWDVPSEMQVGNPNLMASHSPTKSLSWAPAPSTGVRTKGPLSLEAYRINRENMSLPVNLPVIKSIVLSPAISRG